MYWKSLQCFIACNTCVNKSWITSEFIAFLVVIDRRTEKNVYSLQYLDLRRFLSIAFNELPTQNGIYDMTCIRTLPLKKSLPIID